MMHENGTCFDVPGGPLSSPNCWWPCFGVKWSPHVLRDGDGSMEVVVKQLDGVQHVGDREMTRG